ncbi:MAG: SDR family oxidoreductase, partial [Planctomycetota bacterium]
MEFAKQTVVITGASSGIGAAIARELAPRVGRLILVARREDRLRVLADELSVPCDVEPCDLADRHALSKLADRLATREIDGFVNNAGLGSSGCTWTTEEDRLHAMLDVNVRALVVLTRRIVPGMVERGRGFVFNVGSIAGVQPVPFMAVYAATKSFVNHFSEALASELEGTGVWCGVLCPGSTRTEFFDVAEV